MQPVTVAGQSSLVQGEEPGYSGACATIRCGILIRIYHPGKPQQHTPRVAVAEVFVDVCINIDVQNLVETFVQTRQK